MTTQRKPTKMWIKPAMTKVAGRPEETVKLPFKRGADNVFLLPDDGAEVPCDSTPEGLFWKKALRRGEVVKCDPKTKLDRSPEQPKKGKAAQAAKPADKAVTQKQPAKKDSSHE
jgi:hypothetical protein